MAKLDFFSFGDKRKSHPLDDVKSVTEWYAAIQREFAAGSHDQITKLLSQFNQDIDSPGVATLEAIIELDRLGHVPHQQLCAQYLSSKLLPAIELQQRAQILSYGRQLVAAFQRFMSFDPEGEEAPQIRLLLPLVIGKMLFYLTENALWHYYRHASLDEVMWSNVNQLFRYAEEQAIDAVPLQLFPGEATTTIHDLYLAFLMTSLLNSGNLTSRQIHLAYQLALMLSNRMTLSRDLSGESSFIVNIQHATPPSRAHNVPQLQGIRVWSTTELVDQINAWLAVYDGGSTPQALRERFSRGVDPGLLRFLVREWAVKPFRFERAERVPVASKQLEVGRTLSGVHRLVREYEEFLAQGDRQESPSVSVEEVAEIRIYGFLTGRRREKSVAQDEVVKVATGTELQLWDIENQSDSGLGVSLPAAGAEWLSLGALLATREAGQQAWSLSIVRRIKRDDKERMYLGLQLLSSRPVAAYTKAENGRNADLTLPVGMVWNQGEIALFASAMKGGVKCNTLLIPLFSYAHGKKLQMFAKNKGFLVALGRVLEKGADWCQVEIELIRQL
ncbi:hypothetical protein [Vogesella indigofera]|uniref:hypothetical protein n=1 Tax=Vogesella indigofera TaxID=45465 RepID=UPI00234F7FCC|nr:hypothetical protein [Vogesella indigofera]MDC7699818.1 hypothetical protein [Vogesella indigofera]